MLFHFFGKLRLGKSSNAEEQMSREAGEQEKAEEQGGRGAEGQGSRGAGGQRRGTNALRNYFPSSPGHLRTWASPHLCTETSATPHLGTSTFPKLLVLLCALLLGFSTSAPATSCPGTSLASQEGNRERDPMLPVGAKATLGGEVIALEVARTPQQQALGLMYRTDLPENRGMLFDFESPRTAHFWMKNVEIPLDMIFLRDGQIRMIASNVPPCNSTPCPTYGPEGLVDKVIELPGGRAKELGLETGDRVNIEFLKRSGNTSVHQSLTPPNPKIGYSKLYGVVR